MAGRYKESVVIDGLTVRYDPERMSDWTTFNILRGLDGATQYRQVDALFQIIEHVTDQSEGTIVKHCGGGTAQAEDVINLCSRIISELTPKNSASS